MGISSFGEEISLSTKKQMMVSMLEKFQAYCEKYDLRVYLAAGTLLGAVRHQGYIPWDDDMDVMMPMPDYQKLIKLIERNPINKGMHFSTPVNNKNHMWPFLKLIDDSTVLVETVVTGDRKRQQEEYYGVYIDIFPMYGIQGNEMERLEFQSRLSGIYQKFIRSTRVMNRRPKDSLKMYVMRYVLYEIYCFPNRIIGGKHYLMKMNELMLRYPLFESDYFGYAAGLTTESKDHNRTVLLKEEKMLEFENISCKVLAGYDEMLSQQYGNYMKLPPESERRTHPSNAYWRQRGMRL